VRSIKDFLFFIMLLLPFYLYSFNYEKTGYFYKKVGYIEKVIDGDTLKVKIDNKVEKVRLLYIDTMETKFNKKMLKDEREFYVNSKELIYLGRKAYIYLKNFLPKNTKVVLYIPFNHPKDSIKRYLAIVVRFYGGEVVNEQMLVNGFARTYYLHTAPDSISEYYTTLEKKAREKKIGIWKFLEK
jgi:micrococcal nuclease